jgi:hypothetical protein
MEGDGAVKPWFWGNVSGSSQPVRDDDDTEVDDDNDTEVEPCPECGAPLIEKWSGVKCSKCLYWYCL